MTTMMLAAPMVLDHDGDKYTDGMHRRATDRRGSLESRVSQLESELAALKDAPIDGARLSFSTKMVASILSSALFLGVALWSIKADVSALKTATETAQQLSTERLNGVKEQVGMLDKKQELQRLEIQGLKEMILEQRSVRR
jgi:hypothetical protein